MKYERKYASTHKKHTTQQTRKFSDYFTGIPDLLWILFAVLKYVQSTVLYIFIYHEEIK